MISSLHVLQVEMFVYSSRKDNLRKSACVTMAFKI